MKTIILTILSCIILISCNKTDTRNCCKGGKVAGTDSSIIALPDIFTPNGDGINDFLYVQSKNISSLSIMISNQRGNVVFQSTDMTQGWDGAYKGKKSKEREYSFSVDATTVNGKTLNLSGGICVVRDNCIKSPLTNCVFGSQFNGNGFDRNIPSGENIKACN